MKKLMYFALAATLGTAAFAQDPSDDEEKTELNLVSDVDQDDDSNQEVAE